MVVHEANFQEARASPHSHFLSSDSLSVPRRTVSTNVFLPVHFCRVGLKSLAQGPSEWHSPGRFFSRQHPLSVSLCVQRRLCLWSGQKFQDLLSRRTTESMGIQGKQALGPLPLLGAILRALSMSFRDPQRQ